MHLLRLRPSLPHPGRDLGGDHPPCPLQGRFRTRHCRSGACWQWQPGLLARGVHPDGTAERDSDGSHERGLVELLRRYSNSHGSVTSLVRVLHRIEVGDQSGVTAVRSAPPSLRWQWQAGGGRPGVHGQALPGWGDRRRTGRAVRHQPQERAADLAGGRGTEAGVRLNGRSRREYVNVIRAQPRSSATACRRVLPW